MVLLCMYIYLLPFADSSLVSDVASFVSDNHEGSDSDLCPCLMPVVNGFRIAHLNCHSFLLHIKKKSLV